MPQFKNINSSALSFLYSPTLTSIHDHWAKKQDNCGNRWADGDTMHSRGAEKSRGCSRHGNNSGSSAYTECSFSCDISGQNTRESTWYLDKDATSVWQMKPGGNWQLNTGSSSRCRSKKMIQASSKQGQGEPKANPLLLPSIKQDYGSSLLREEWKGVNRAQGPIGNTARQGAGMVPPRPRRRASL